MSGLMSAGSGVHGGDVGFSLAGREILTGVTFSAPPGALVAFTGASGSGKTTALNISGLLLRPTHGRILVDDVDATRWSTGRRRLFWRDRAAFIVQDHGLVPDETVAGNVTLALSRRHGRRTARQRSAREALAEVGLEERLADPVAQLSGGERQRVAIARAIAKGADCLFADEPTASLDAANRALVYELLRGRADAGASVLVATHDEWFVRQCDAEVALIG